MAHLGPISTRLLPPPPQHIPEVPVPAPSRRSLCFCSESNLNPPGFAGRGPTLLGCTARRRFSIHLSRSAADRQEKHLLPDDVVTCGGRIGQCHGRGMQQGWAQKTPGAWGAWGAWGALGARCAAPPQGGGRTWLRRTPCLTSAGAAPIGPEPVGDGGALPCSPWCRVWPGSSCLPRCPVCKAVSSDSNLTLLTMGREKACGACPGQKATLTPSLPLQGEPQAPRTQPQGGTRILSVLS